jgi:site-specific recombinase XerC
MQSNVILQKKKRGDNFGYLFILYSDGKKRQKKSLNRRMTEDEYKFYNKEFKAFSKNKRFDVTELNIQISNLININVFEEPIEKKVEVETSFLNYYKNQMNKIDKPSTKKSYENSLNKLNQYLLSKNKSDLLFTDLKKEFITTYITFLRNKSLTDSTIKTYLSSMKAVMNTAIDDEDLNVNFPKNPFRKLELKIDVKPKRLATGEDISKLRRITREDELFIYSRMFLLSLYTNGMRVSDLILLKVGNFTKDYCEYMMLKNKKSMKIDIDRNINKMLIDVLDANSSHIDHPIPI